MELPAITTPRVLQAANLPAAQEKTSAVYAKPAKPVPIHRRLRQKKSRSPVRPGHGQANEKDEKEKKVKKQKRRGKSVARKANDKVNYGNLDASMPMPISNHEAPVWRSRVDEKVQKAKQQMTEAAKHRLLIARKASEEQRARAREHAARLQRLQNEITQLPEISPEDVPQIGKEAGEAHPRYEFLKRHSAQHKEHLHQDDALLQGDDDSRPASVLGLLELNTDKKTRMQHLSQKRRIYSKMIRKQKFIEEQRKLFNELDEDEQELLKKVFERDRSPEQLPYRLAERGIKGKDEEEAYAISKLCEVYLAAGTDDLLTFAVNLVPVARRKLQEPYSLTCRDAFNAVPKYGFNDGLDEEHVLEILQDMYVARVSGTDLSMMKRELADTFAKLMDPDTGKIDCDDFCDLMWHVREAYDRECAGRDWDIMEKFGIHDFDDDLKDVKDELLAIHAVLCKQKNEDGDIKFDIVDVRAIVGILTESGLCSGDKDELDFIEDRIEELITKGNLGFHDLRKLIEQLRTRAQQKRKARDWPIFRQYDKDHNGVLDLSEAGDFMKDLGLVPRSKQDQDELKWLLEEADADKSGGIDFEEFQCLVQKVSQKLRATQRAREKNVSAHLHYSPEQLSQLREAFFSLDHHQYLGIDIHGCRRALELMRISMSGDRLNELFAIFDRTGLGHLKFEEFLFFVTAVDKPSVDWKENWKRFIEDEM